MSGHSKLGRRSLVKVAFASSALATLPLLRHISRAATDGCRRFVFFVEGNGLEPVTLLAPSARAALDATMASPIGSRRYWFEQYRHDRALAVVSPDLEEAKSLLSLRSLKDRATVVLGLSSKVSGGGHSNFHGGLSCTRSVDSAPGGPTIDAVVAPAVREDTPFDVVRLGVANTARTLDFGVTAAGEGDPTPVILSPQVAQSILFSRALDPRAFAQRTDTLDTVRRGVELSLADFPSGDERTKLERYAESVEVLIERQRALDAFEFSTVPERLSPTGDPLERFAHQAELATAALIGGLTNVAVLPIGTGGEGLFNLAYGGAFEGLKRHGLHHESEDNPDLADRIHEISAVQISAMVQMAEALARTPDVAGGDMLSRTALIYLPDTGEKHHSEASDFPALILGGEALGLRRGGRTVVYPGIGAAEHRQVSNLWNTVGHLAGLDLNDFGGEDERTRMAQGPLSELLA
ncbi:MAG: DUF1552 domain-containing protein [Myxococcota bacterium]